MVEEHSIMEKRKAIRDLLEIAKYKEVSPARKPPVLMEMMEGTEGEPAHVSKAREGSRKDILIKLFQEAVLPEKEDIEPLPDETIPEIYENMDIIVTGLQELHPHHIPRWYEKYREKADAVKRVKETLTHAKELRGYIEQMPENYKKAAAATYVLLALNHHEGVEKAKQLFSHVIERKKYEHLRHVLSFGMISRGTAPLLVDMIQRAGEGKGLGKHLEPILNTAEDALWSVKMNKRLARDAHKTAMKILKALEKIDDPKILEEEVTNPRNGKKFPLLDEITYRLKKIKENPDEHSYHAKRIDKAVGEALNRIVSKQRRYRWD